MDLSALVAFCRSNGIREIEHEGTRILFGPPVSEPKETKPGKQYTTEDFMFSATEGLPDLDEA